MPRQQNQTKREDRKVITLWGHRGWHSPDSEGYNTRSINRGQGGLNEAIQDIAKQVTIHSVSQSSIVISLHGEQIQLLYMSATILYSGDLDTSEGTVFEVHL